MDTRPRDVETLLADWLVGFRLADAPSAVVDTARLCLLDTIGVAVAGTSSPVYRRCRSLCGEGPSTLFGTGSGAPDAGWAAFFNGVAAHALDFDDTSYAGIVHGSAVVLPAALAATEAAHGDGTALLEAYIAGAEVQYSLGLALGDRLYHKGHWSTATLGVIGAAAGAAKAFGLGRDTAAQALRLAANLPIGLRASHGSANKPYLCGVAARLGYEAAAAARAGIDGNPMTFTGRHGFATVLNDGQFDDGPLAELGKVFRLLEPGIAFKIYPLCSATQAAIEAVLELRRERPIDGARVRSIECYSTPLVVSCLPYAAPVSQEQAQFSMTFAISCALLHGTVDFEHFSESHLRSPELVALMSRVRLQAGTRLVGEADRLRYPEASRVVIHDQDGRRLERTVLAATGMPARPATREMLAAKFLRCATLQLSAAAARALMVRLNVPERASSIADLLHGPCEHRSPAG
jgi:2-methylcitrate dehydratase PrpD